MDRAIESLRAGYEAGEAPTYTFDDNGRLTTTRRGLSPGEARATQGDPEAFDLGVELAQVLYAVQTASVSEYEADVERFDQVANAINERFGPVVGLSRTEEAFRVRLPTAGEQTGT